MMGVCKYSGKKRTGYGIDYSFKGKRIRERVGSDKKEAAEYLGKKLKEIRDGEFRKGPEKVVLFDELAEDYEKQAHGKKSYKNEKYYIKTLRTYFAGRILPELTVLDIERFGTQRKESPTSAKKTRSGATVNREMACLRAMLNKAVKREMIPKHPASQVKAFNESSGRNCFLSADEAGGLLEACSRHLRPIVLCALETEMRRAEILGLRWSDIRTEWKAWKNPSRIWS
jgi:integrase